jgi:signal transduction histidine kinase
MTGQVRKLRDQVIALWNSPVPGTVLRLVPTCLVAATLVVTATSQDRQRLPFPLILLLAAMAVAGNLSLVRLRYGEALGGHTVGLLLFVVAGSLLYFALPDSVLVVLPFWAARAAVRYHLPGRAEILVVLLSIAGASLPILKTSGSPGAAIGTAVGVVALVLAAVNRRAREQQLEELQVSLARKQAAIEEHSRAAALAERARIARDVHDVLAHSLAGLSLSLQGTRLMLVRDGASEEAIDQVTRAQGLAADGLAEARRAVATLREDAVPDVRAMADLVTAFRLETGAEAAFEVMGEPRELGAEPMMALYRGLQEALTNTRKHAAGAAVGVVLAYEDGRTVLAVGDHPGRPPAHGVGGGYGLLGMRERAELIGGSLEVGPTEDGWRVRLVVPV